MGEVVDVAFTIFWALVISVVALSALGTLAVLSLTVLVTWLIRMWRDHSSGRGAGETEDTGSPPEAGDGPSYEEAA